MYNLAAEFEIGAHTLNHRSLTTLAYQTACDQISGSKKWIADLVGRPCNAFAPPRGHYKPSHCHAVADAGFQVMRTVEMMSLAGMRMAGSLAVMPTTVQAHAHPGRALWRNVLRRGGLHNVKVLMQAKGTRWPIMLESLLQHVAQHGGIVHLWGHSWEIEEAQAWPQLWEALDRMAAQRDSVCPVSNVELFRRLTHQDGPTLSDSQAIAPRGMS